MAATIHVIKAKGVRFPGYSLPLVKTLLGIFAHFDLTNCNTSSSTDEREREIVKARVRFG